MKNEKLILKRKYINDLLKEIITCAERKDRGTDERKYLAGDLETIKKMTQRVLRILNDGRTYYTEYQITNDDLQEFLNDVNKAVAKQ